MLIFIISTILILGPTIGFIWIFFPRSSNPESRHLEWALFWNAFAFNKRAKNSFRTYLQMKIDNYVPAS